MVHSVETFERVTWLRSPALPGVELLDVANGTHGWNVFHERYTVCSILGGGTARWHYRGQSREFYPGSLGLFEPGEAHITTSVNGFGNFQVLLVAPEPFLRAAEEEGRPGVVHFRRAMLEDPRLMDAIRGLADALQAGGSPLEQQAWLALCLRGIRACAERSPGAPAALMRGNAVRRAMDYLRDCYQEPVDLEDLASLTGLGRFSLIHAFSSRVGMPPHAYQIHVRVERARALLAAGVPAAQAAAEVGFVDQSHFIRHFKRILHVTPGQYARSLPRTVAWV
jgi:AraC-like DNA-binding protein